MKRTTNDLRPTGRRHPGTLRPADGRYAVRHCKKSRALALPKGNFAFERALEAPGVSLICEVKKASPSKGLISPDFPYLDIARDYAAAGAAAISCLTEPDYFLGDDRYLQEIAAAVPIPVLRKDFTLYDYQIYEAKVLGAGAVLLICALLDTDTLRRYIEICDTLGLSALVEAPTTEKSPVRWLPARPGDRGSTIET